MVALTPDALWKASKCIVSDIDMSESHSMKLVCATTATVQRYLDDQGRKELPTMQTPPYGFHMRLKHGVNKLLRLAGLHISRAVIHDEAIARRYSAIAKSVALGTVLRLWSDPAEFDAVYAALADEASRQVFDWFICYRTALTLLGEDASDVVPGAMSGDAWQAVLQRASQMFVRGAYRINGLIVDSGLEEVAATFLLEQYRLKNIVEPQTGDIVLDCGAYKGETALWFAQQVGSSGRVVAFEPDARNALSLRHNLLMNQSAEVAPVSVVESAVSRTAGTLCFNAGAEGSSRADAAAAQVVPATTIDDAMRQEQLDRVDFIKMDIEGGEVDALTGAARTLERFTPRLAISVYHRPGDLPDIVGLIRRASPNYQLYLSQKSPGVAETVLFACCDQAGRSAYA